MQFGGEEPKCVSEEWETMIGAPLGMPCPRVDLWPELRPVSDIIEFALNEKLRSALPLRAELTGECYDMTSEELNDTLSLVSAALSHPSITAILNPVVPRD